jgi:hypothetical protein
MKAGMQLDYPKNEVKEADLSLLAGAHVAPCISIYLSAGTSVDAVKRDRGHLNELLRAAEPDLRARSMTPDEVLELIEAGRKANEVPQEPASAPVTSLALFASNGLFHSYRLPAAFASRVLVGSEFFIRPLLSFAAGSDRFFLLALSQNHVRLFEGSRFKIRELALRKTPENLREDLETFHFERETGFHTTTTPSHSANRRDKRGLVYHGAEPKPDRKERISHFFCDVEAGVAESLKGQNAPLVVATVDYLFPLYEKANTYAHLLGESISGNPDLLSPNALHSAAWKLAEKNIEAAHAKAFSVYQGHINSERTSTNVRKVVAEANSGHVRFLFVSQGAEQWGSLVPPDTVHVHAQREPGDDELLNLAAVLTIRNGGRVFVVPPDKLPQGATVAAVLRF